MTYREVLDLAIKRIEQGWCQGACAKDAAGFVRPTTSAFARQWSLFGAVLHESARGAAGEPTLYDLIENKLATVRPRGERELIQIHRACVFEKDPVPTPLERYELEEWNDAPGRTREEVLAVLQAVRADLPP